MKRERMWEKWTRYSAFGRPSRMLGQAETKEAAREIPCGHHPDYCTCEVVRAGVVRPDSSGWLEFFWDEDGPEVED